MKVLENIKKSYKNREVVNNYKFFDNNKKKLIKKYPGLYLLIKNKRIKGAFSSIYSAVKYAAFKKYKYGSFSIQKAIDEPENYHYWDEESLNQLKSLGYKGITPSK